MIENFPGETGKGEHIPTYESQRTTNTERRIIMLACIDPGNHVSIKNLSPRSPWQTSSVQHRNQPLGQLIQPNSSDPFRSLPRRILLHAVFLRAWRILPIVGGLCRPPICSSCEMFDCANLESCCASSSGPESVAAWAKAASWRASALLSLSSWGR